MKVGVLHAYSRTNAGDGLLVDLTLERLRRAGVASDDVVIVALDAESFGDQTSVLHAGTSTRAFGIELLRGCGRSVALVLCAVTGGRPGRAFTELGRCDAFVAVGGGYLRAADATSSIGTMLNHLPQLLLVRRRRTPTAYLPQSIGPLRGLTGRAVRRLLRAPDHIWVRDRWSAAELAGRPNVSEVPDLAVLHLAEQLAVGEIPVRSGGSVALVGRAVSHIPGLGDQLCALARALEHPHQWALQSTGDRSKSDATFYRDLGVAAAGPLGAVIDRDAGAVVSVRLHGAIMALLRGVPAVHLAYDRKGPAAYEALGLGDYCFDARSFDPAGTARVVDRLVHDPSPFWDACQRAVPGLVEASAQLDEELQDLLASATVR